MERRQSLVHAVNKTLVDGDGNVRTVERGIQRNFILPGLRVELVRLHLTVQRGAERAFELAELGEERLHHLLAILPIRHRAVQAVTRRIEPYGLAVAQRNRGIRKVGIRQDVVRGGRRADRHRRGSKQPLFRIAQRVRLATLNVVEVMLVRLEARLLANPAIHLRFADLQNLRLDECDCLTKARGDLLHLLLHALVPGDARVLVGEETGVEVDLLQFLRDAVDRVQRVGEARRGRAERALERRDRCDLRLQFVLGLTPGALGRIEVGEIPFVFVGDGGAAAVLRNDCAGQRGNEHQTGDGSSMSHVRRIRDLTRRGLESSLTYHWPACPTT